MRFFFLNRKFITWVAGNKLSISITTSFIQLLQISSINDMLYIYLLNLTNTNTIPQSLPQQYRYHLPPHLLISPPSSPRTKNSHHHKLTDYIWLRKIRFIVDNNHVSWTFICVYFIICRSWWRLCVFFLLSRGWMARRGGLWREGYLGGKEEDVWNTGNDYGVVLDLSV